MNFTKTTSNDFALLKNGIDENIEIIQHKATGFYNVTKMCKLVFRIQQREEMEKASKNKNDKTTNPGRSSEVQKKEPSGWFKTDSAKKLVQACMEDTNLECVHYELAAGTKKLYSGTYVHRYLYDQFMGWLDSKYAIRVAKILDQIHKDAQRVLTKEKDEKIDRLERKIDELLGYAIDTKDTLDDVQNDLTEAREDIQIATTYLVEKSKTSTLNPADPNKHHCFAATGFKKASGERIVKFIAGQKSYVDKTIDKNVNVNNHAIVIKPFYNANGIDLRQNAHAEFGVRRNQVIDRINKENKAADAAFNAQLRTEIRNHNKHSETKRVYADEKKVTPKIKVKDISVKFSKLSFTYVANDYMSYDDVLQIVIDVNDITQSSPISSEDEDDDDMPDLV